MAMPKPRVAEEEEQQRDQGHGGDDDHEVFDRDHQPLALAAEPDHFVLVGHRQRVGLGAPVGNHGHQAARQVAEADGHHDHGKGRLAEQGTQHQAFGAHAEQHHDDDGQQEGEPERQPGDGHRGQADEAAHHHQVALGEIDGFGRLVDQHEAEGDQGVDTADRRSADSQLQELQHPGFSSGGIWLFIALFGSAADYALCR
jgi:hypothetical protein